MSKDLQSLGQAVNEEDTRTVADCRQELVFIGIDMDEIAIYDSLQECLLTDQELSVGPQAWATFADPFPKWNRTVDELLLSLEAANRQP